MKVTVKSWTQIQEAGIDIEHETGMVEADFKKEIECRDVEAFTVEGWAIPFKMANIEYEKKVMSALADLEELFTDKDWCNCDECITTPNYLLKRLKTIKEGLWLQEKTSEAKG